MARALKGRPAWRPDHPTLIYVQRGISRSRGDGTVNESDRVGRPRPRTVERVEAACLRRGTRPTERLARRRRPLVHER